MCRLSISEISICSWFENHFIGNQEDRFSCVEAQLVFIYNFNPVKDKPIKEVSYCVSLD